MDRIPDPYRELGILRGATDAQVKAAHRRLAKRFHPDASEGDHDRFLAIQEAYSLLSDPMRRRDWDAKHTSGPVRAGDPGPRRSGRGGGSSRPAREAGSAGTRRAAGPAAGSPKARGGAAAGAAGAKGPGSPGGGDRADGAKDAEHAGAWSASDRDPSSRSTTWSASGVPWWEDFSPRDRGAGSAGAGSGAKAGATGGSHPPRGSGAPRGTSRAAPGSGKPGSGTPGAAGPGAPSEAAGTGTGGHRTTAQRSPEDVDVYSRSSGAAWSMAARRYFRKGEAELPKGGAWTYRGTQVVTGAEARKVNEEVAARRRAAESVLRSRGAGAAAPRTAFGHEDRSDGPPPASRAREGAPAPGAPAPGWAPDATQPAAPATSTRTAASGPTPASSPSTAVSPATEASLLRRVRRALGLGG